MEGVSGYEANSRNGNRLVRVIPRQEIVSKLNLSVFDVATAINSAITGIKVGVYIENGKVYAYQTQDGQKGVVYIQNLTGNAGSSDDPTVTATIVTKLQAK